MKPKHFHQYRWTERVTNAEGFVCNKGVCSCGREKLSKIYIPKPTKIGTRSAKGRARDAKYNKLKSMDERRGVCARCQLTDRIECHHPRGRVGENLYYFVFLCHECHAWVHYNPADAKAEGWLEKR